MCINPKTLIPFFDKEKNAVSYRFSGASFLNTHDANFLLEETTGEVFECLPVACGKCLECINKHKVEWVFRLMYEVRLHDVNTFVTLTYKDAPEHGVEKRDVQLFMKRLRKKFGSKIRFYCTGEYGSRGKRPHYHVLLFGFDFPDKQYFCMDKKHNKMYRSTSLEKLWPYGFSSIVDVGDASMNYITKDMQKLLPIEEGRNKPFTLMSLKPGIGIDYCKPDKKNNKIYLNGKSINIPRYFREKLLTNEEKNDIILLNKKLYENVDIEKETEYRRLLEKQRKDKLYESKTFRKN